MRRRETAPPTRHDEFVFWVRAPALRYGFAVQHRKDEIDPVSERLSLSFEFECLSPDRFKGRVARVDFFHDDDLRRDSKYRARPLQPLNAVASLSVRGAKFDFGGHLPPEALWQLSGAMAAGTITSLTAGAEWVGRGRALVGSLAFHGPDFDPIEYIG